MSTKVIVIASTKGGSGKSSIASALGVCAASDGYKITLVDADPQQSAGFWWDRRGKPDNPDLATVHNERELARTIGRLRVSDRDWIIVDSPPALIERVEAAVELADFVIIPARPSIFDVEAVSPAVELCKEAGRPYAFVVTQADTRWKLLPGFIDALKDFGPVLGEHMSYADVYASALTTGKTGPEMRGKAGSDARDEITALWKAIKKRIARGARP
jgi:chromosome partitioning protein